MGKYQTDYSAAVRTKEGKTAGILVETSAFGARAGVYEQYRRWIKMKEGMKKAIANC